MATANTVEIDFKENADVAKVAEAYSLDCIDFVKKSFGIELDWSDSSVQVVEDLLSQLSSAVNSPNPPPKERVSDFSKIFGFYVGEVYRKNHGGVVWGDIFISGQKYYGLGSEKDTKAPRFWPTVKANKRIVLGDSENVWHYYQAIIKK